MGALVLKRMRLCATAKEQQSRCNYLNRLEAAINTTRPQRHMHHSTATHHPTPLPPTFKPQHARQQLRVVN